LLIKDQIKRKFYPAGLLISQSRLYSYRSCRERNVFKNDGLHALLSVLHQLDFSQADAHGTVTRSALTTGVPYFRDLGVEHDVLNGNDFAFAFIEVELLDRAKGSRMTDPKICAQIAYFANPQRIGLRRRDTVR